jgi:hypothetical protein
VEGREESMKVIKQREVRKRKREDTRKQHSKVRDEKVCELEGEIEGGIEGGRGEQKMERGTVLVG